MIFDKDNMILPLTALNAELLKQYAAVPDKHIEAKGFGTQIAQASNGAPEFSKWASQIVRLALMSMATRPEKADTALPALFMFAVFTGWELAQLHIDNQMKATESSAS